MEQEKIIEMIKILEFTSHLKSHVLHIVLLFSA